MSDPSWYRSIFQLLLLLLDPFLTHFLFPVQDSYF